MPSPPPLCLISLGNPGARYALTRHNAGHIVLSALAGLLNAAPFGPSLHGPGIGTTATVPIKATRAARSKKKAAAASSEGVEAVPPSPSGPPCLPPTPPVSIPRPFPAQWYLHQNPTLMNISGPTVKSVWSAFLRAQRQQSALSSFSSPSSLSSEVVEEQQQQQPPLLLLLHDSLEDALGKVRVQKDGMGVSARGHNGVTSVLSSFGSSGTPRKGGIRAGAGAFVRINIGIGRPEGRGQGEVSGYVLGEFTRGELEVLRGRVAEEVLRVVRGLSAWSV